MKVERIVIVKLCTDTKRGDNGTEGLGKTDSIIKIDQNTDKGPGD